MSRKSAMLMPLYKTNQSGLGWVEDAYSPGGALVTITPTGSEEGGRTRSEPITTTNSEPTPSSTSPDETKSTKSSADEDSDTTNKSFLSKAGVSPLMIAGSLLVAGGAIAYSMKN
ncbi:MAG: hypothetical protein WEA58_04045 [Balneolaceae bacterium]